MSQTKGFIDADGHIVEGDRELLKFLPAPFKDREDLLSFPFSRRWTVSIARREEVADGKGRYIAKGSLKRVARVSRRGSNRLVGIVSDRGADVRPGERQGLGLRGCRRLQQLSYTKLSRNRSGGSKGWP